MGIANLLKPSSKKILISTAISLILVIMAFLFGYRFFSGMQMKRLILSLAITLIVGAILYYPLSCGLLICYNKIKKRKVDRKDLTIGIIFILLLNPVTYPLAYSSYTYVWNNVINQPCGVDIIGFAKESPAKDAGITLTESIILADGEKIDNTNGLIHALAEKKPGDYIKIKTNISEYDLLTIAAPNSQNSAVIGVNVRDKICKR